jgi:uncharacterized repeat protein (TIGR01451 family)
MAILITAILLISASGLLTPATAADKYHWEQVSEEGFSDLTNDYVWSMASYTVNRTEYLYAGTLNTNFSSALDDWTNWSNVTDGCEIWRTNGTEGPDGKYLWEQVVGPVGTQDIIISELLPTVDATAGFRSYCIGTRGMIVFANLLWVGTSNPITGAQIWVTNGTHWKRANVPGFGPNENETSSSRGMAVFNGSLYVGTENEVDGAGVFRYNGSTDFTEIGNALNITRWERVNELGFGEPGVNFAVGELITFSASPDYLYAGTWNATGPLLVDGLVKRDFGFLAGCQVWRTNGTVNASDPPRLLWEKVVDSGFSSEGGSPLNGAIMSSAIFNGSLYMGTQNFVSGAEIWRTANGTGWERVANFGFFNLTNFDFRGFGNGYMWCMINFSDQLFVGTLNPILGCQVWRSTTGDPDSFEQVNVNGMNEERKIPIMELMLINDTYPIMGVDQYGVRTFAEFNGSLHLGTASFGDWIDKLINEALKDESYNLSDYLGNWTSNFSDYVGCEVWRINETTYTPPTVEVTKTVWDPYGEEWRDADCPPLLANVSDTVRFNVSIHANGTYNLTNLTIIDFLSSSLEYNDTATLRHPDGTEVSREPEPVIRREWNCCCFATSWTILVWNLSDVVLAPCQTMTLEYNATIARCGVETAGLLGSRGIDLNFLFAKGQNAETQEYGYGWDYALVSAPCPEGNATDVLGDVVEVYASGETVYATGSGFRPNSTVDIYILRDRAWANGDNVSDFFIFMVRKNVPTNAAGEIIAAEIWPNPIPGEYDMFFDANQNGIFEVGVDAVDHPNHPGFIVQGAAAVLTPLGLLALVGLLCIIATRTMVRTKKR